MATQRKTPAKRLFTGLSGSPLAQIAVEAPPPLAPKAAKTPIKNMVLLHFCFNQQDGETKKEWCSCKKRVTREAAVALVKEHCADWLLTKNARARSGVSEFHRAIVVRAVIVNGETLYSVEPPLPIDRRDKKHEAIKETIRNRARRLLQKMFGKGVISQAILEMPNTELDELLSDAYNVDKF